MSWIQSWILKIKDKQDANDLERLVHKYDAEKLIFKILNQYATEKGKFWILSDLTKTFLPGKHIQGSYKGKKK